MDFMINVTESMEITMSGNVLFNFLIIYLSLLSLKISSSVSMEVFPRALRL